MTTARQATCIAIGARGVLIEGAPGSGKSSLALALIDRGAELVGDDSVLIDTFAGRVIARPHPNTHGLIEVRNLGLLTLPVREEVAVALIIRLEPAAPRHIALPDKLDIAGVDLPLVRLWPDSPVAAIKAELALATFGLAGI